MGEVVQLTVPQRCANNPPDGEEKIQMTDRIESEEERKARVLSRIDAKPGTNFRDRVQIARNLWDILHSEGMSKKPADILIEAKKSHDGDSTKRLNLYAIPSDLPGDEAERRGGKLRKGVRHYVDIARAVAESANLPADHFLLQLFSSTSFLESTEVVSEAVSPHFVFMADMLQQAADWICRRHELKRFFEEAPNRPYGYDLLEDGALHLNGFPGNPFDIQDRSASYCADGLALPSLHLLTAPLGPPVKGTLDIDPVPVMRPIQTDPASDPFGMMPAFNWQHALLIPEAPSPGNGLAVQMWLSREVWLTIAPMGVDHRPIPCFDARTCTSISDTSGKFLRLAFSYWNDAPRLYFRSGPHLHSATFTPGPGQPPINRTSVHHPFEPSLPRSNEIEMLSAVKGIPFALPGTYFYYERIDHRSCQKFLDVQPGEGWGINSEIQQDGVPAYWPRGTMGAIIEAALLGDNDETRFDSIWDAAVGNYIERHRSFLKAHRRAADDQLALLRQKWRQEGAR